MKKLLGVLSLGLACTMMFGCTKPAPKPEPGPDPKDEILVVNDFEEVVVAGQGKIIVDESEVDNGWAYKEGINVMQAISLNQLKALDEALEAKVEEKGVRGLYKKEGVVLGTNDAGWPAKKVENGEAVEVNGSYAVKCAGAAENDDGVMAIDNDLYYTGPGHHGESLTPDTLFVTDNMTGTADSYGLDHNANPIARAAGVYTVILAIYKAPLGENNLVCGLGLLKTADRDPYVAPDTPTAYPVEKLEVIGGWVADWSDPREMTKDGTTFTYQLVLEADVTMKVRVNGEWKVSFGATALSTKVVSDNDGDIALKAGTWNITVKLATLDDIKVGDTLEEFKIEAEGQAAQDTVLTVTVADLATANEWANGTLYASAKLDEVISASVTDEGVQSGENVYHNSGKYYSSDSSWRLYQNDKGKMTLSAAEGHTIVSIKVTYNIGNTGILLVGETQLASGDAFEVNGASVELMVGNTGEATNGQAKITAIEVSYK